MVESTFGRVAGEPGLAGIGEIGVFHPPFDVTNDLIARINSAMKAAGSPANTSSK
jgi:hypothetical protein